MFWVNRNSGILGRHCSIPYNVLLVCLFINPYYTQSSLLRGLSLVSVNRSYSAAVHQFLTAVVPLVAGSSAHGLHIQGPRAQ